MPLQQSLSDLPYEAERLADDLTQGNPAFGWKGDARLSLFVGILACGKAGYKNGVYYKEGEPMARRYEVWRHNEDGTDKRIMSRPLHLVHEILPTMVSLDPRTPGHEATMDRIERENKKVDADKEYAIGQAHGEMTEHLWSIVHDRNNPQNTFRQVGGSDERPDRNLAT